MIWVGNTIAKTVFITGTSSGHGKFTAIRFAKLGWNVAATMRTPEKETELTQFDNIVRGPINVIRAFLPHFRANKEGMFINISSFMGITTAVPIGSLYNMSKFAKNFGSDCCTLGQMQV